MIPNFSVSYNDPKNDPKALQHFSNVLQGKKLPFEFISLVLQLFHFIVREEISNICDKVNIDTIHITWCGYNSIHIFVAIMNTFFYLGKTEKVILKNSKQSNLKRCTNYFKLLQVFVWFLFFCFVSFFRKHLVFQETISVLPKNKKQVSDLFKRDYELT